MMIRAKFAKRQGHKFGLGEIPNDAV